MARALLSDFRYAVRGLSRRPGSALSCVLVLAVGIGAVTAMFSAVYAVVLRPLPFEDPGRLVWAWGTTTNITSNTLSAVDYYDYKEQNDVFSSLAAHLVWRPPAVITGGDEPERVLTTRVSANLFPTLGVTPFLGRGFLDTEEVAGGPHVVVLSYGYWQRRLGADPDVVGTHLTVDGTSYEVVGVMPRGYEYPEDVELYLPMQRGREGFESGRGNRNFNVIGRLADGVTLEQAQSQMSVLAEGLARAYPDADESWGVRLEPLQERFVGELRTAMTLLMGAVVLVLLVACANASSLLLARVAARRGELAVRMALGASRPALLRQLFAETLLITLLGAGVGLALAVMAIDLLHGLGGAALPRLGTVGLDPTVLGVAALATVGSALLVGATSALRSTRLDPVEHLKEGGRTTDAARTLRLRHALVVGQVALSLVLLVGSGLLIRSLARLQGVPPGFEPDGLLTMEVQLPAHYETAEAREAFFATALERIRGLPGVRGASAADRIPPSGAGPWNEIWPKDRPPANPAAAPGATRRVVMEEYFQTLGVPLLAGRTFRPGDRDGSATVTVVSRALARKMFPGEPVVGRVLILPWTKEGIPLEIVGVVGDVCARGLDDERGPVFYLPYRQLQSLSQRLVIRGDGDAARLTPAVRSVIHELEKDAPISNVETMADRLRESTSRRRFQTALLGAFAAAALLLAAIGLYGVLACSVGERTREIGVRMAMGAAGTDVVREVVARGARITAGGIAVGLVGGVVASRMLRSLLYGVGPSDPTTYAGVSLLLAVVALVACLVPALRAARVDPIVALRHE
jgi:putative ABC transport system permease protein